MQVIGSIFAGSSKTGDFGWMIEQPEYGDSLFIFNDNEEQFLATGIPTGAKGRGYNELSAQVKQVIDDAIAAIRHLVGTGRYQRVFYSAANAAGDLGTGIFDVSDELVSAVNAVFSIHFSSTGSPCRYRASKSCDHRARIRRASRRDHGEPTTYSI